METRVQERLRAAFPNAFPGDGSPPAHVVREPGPGVERTISERHLHCIWFDERLRPEGLTTRDGEPVTVEDPGAWNLEAGPDFLGAVIRVGTAERRFCGDVEIHFRGGDWTAHGHADDPRYRGVRVHVTYHSGPSIADRLPPGTLEIALLPALQRRPDFDPHAIELTAYPYGERAVRPPCREILGTWEAGAKLALLSRAGEARLLDKAAQLAEREARTGSRQAVYEQFLAGLGYRDNKQSCRTLARRVPVERLVELSGGDPVAAYALLVGAGGLLPDPASIKEEDARAFVRQCWDVFWPLRDRLEGGAMPAESWVRSGIRPLNQPVRRLMAAALAFAGGGLERMLEQLLPLRMDQALAAWLHMPADWPDTFWSRRAGWDSRPLDRPAALLGPDRLKALFTNLVVPWIALHRDPPAPLAGLDALPPEPANSVLKQAAFYLFGPDMPTSYLKSGLRQQGLLHLFHQFCLADRTRCVSCVFPELLARSEGKS